MSKALIDRIRKQRELKVEVNGFTFIARRPTDLDMTKLESARDLGQRFVVGWEGFTENDVAGGGGTDIVPFDADLWAEVWADHTEFWDPISTAIVEAYKAHVAARETVRKNSLPG